MRHLYLQLSLFSSSSSRTINVFLFSNVYTPSVDDLHHHLPKIALMDTTCVFITTHDDDAVQRGSEQGFWKIVPLFYQQQQH